MRKVNNAIEIISEKSANFKKSCLCWYDINPGNILITKQEKSYKLNALIDPGGARWGVPEWDIVFIKMQLCNTQEEFEYFLEKYKNENSQIKIDIELVNALAIIVEFDVMEIEFSKNIIISPIPFDTNFKREFEAIHKHIKMENERLKFTY